MSDLPRDTQMRLQRRDVLGDLSRDITMAQCIGWMAERLENP